MSTFIVDDQDASIEYTGFWNVSGQQPDFSQTSSSGSSGATMSFTFSGNLITAVGDFFAGGTCNGTFSIDGASATNFTSPSTNVNLFQQTLWTSPTLEDGNHTLFYTVSSCNTSGSFVWLDYLLYNSSNSSVTGATSFFDDTDSSITYSGSRDSTSGVGDFRETITGVGQGGSFQFDFDGTSVQVFGVVDNSTAGEVTEASFSVDGSPAVAYTTVTSNNILHNTQFFASRPLSQGQHKLTVTNTGGFPVWVDYLVVRGQTSVGASMPTTNNSLSSAHRHHIYLIVGIAVGSVCGILLILALITFLYRNCQMLPFISKRSKQHDTRQRDSGPPPGPTDLGEALHHPKFVPYDSSSFSKFADSSVELHPLAYRQVGEHSPYSSPASTHRQLQAPSELGYGFEIHAGHAVNLSREASYNSLPNPYSIISNGSYRSGSPQNLSIDRSRTVYSSSTVHAETAQRVLLSKTPSESSAGVGTSDGYGFNFTPSRQMRRVVANMNDDEENMSVAELKRSQSQLFLLSVDGMASLPLVHTDSGLRLHSSQDPEAQPELPPLYTEE